MSTKENVVAYVLLITDSNSTQEVLKELRMKKEVLEAYMIYGDWDIVLKVKLSDLAEMTKFMMELRKSFEIKKSSTLITLAD
jgi:DNA-binding Lrp family transcriptional regulator